MARVRRGDQVKVITGRYKGKQGKVLALKGERVLLEGGVNLKVHVKAGRDRKVPQGGIIEKFGTVHLSNVMPLDPSGKPTRVRTKRLEDGRKVRVSTRSGETLAETK
jgi:large subunit ribosomal protein L24